MVIPERMHAIEVREPGSADVMKMTTLPIPRPQEGEVLIQVAACGVNRPDILQRKGLYPPPKGASPLLGLEVAGTIVAVGRGVDPAVINKEVCALVPGGGYAQFCKTPYVHCLPIPDALTIVEAASLPETYFTVWSNVFERAKLTTGETLFVQGGSGGVGLSAIQMAAALGNTVYATAGSAEKCALCEKLGAKKAINYKSEDFFTVLKESGEINVILDMIGGDLVSKEVSLLAEDGRLVFVGAMGGVKGTVPILDVISKRLTITGSSLRPRSISYKAQIAEALLQKIWPFLDSGTIKPTIYKTFPLESAADAHRLMESGDHFGKIVLTIS